MRELARAKINLTLHVTGRRPDGLHVLDSLVVFAECGDVLEAEPASTLSLTLDGPFGSALDAGGDNLVLRAAERMGGPGAALRLWKNLPVASGIGGGSADAAAAVRLLARMNGGALPEAATLTALGADVPVCLSAAPQRMRGIGEELSVAPALPPAWLVLVNPGVPVATARVFARLERFGRPIDLPERFTDFHNFAGWLREQRNDLEAPARAVAPVLDQVLPELAALPGAALARMSGSGATCFALFGSDAEALAAAETLRRAHPGWWVMPTAIAASG
ncbi:4-(cytidine 5'-diphospho)-2-C-methyl-D-erythritol kinase [Pontivivens ytuae]|uniref:4-diphosphocytidyl-2-C-methyl-D-erythritol kinase n=1 Tax=Pontivivens ytuae TaxID=2789856 RepID=A0A7S9LW13_9RHOB|nr:4-(cytidine 5'-diphospho)-2-C-methyl-D-erythritol kinase [Pontivivens ytuae]